MGNRVSLLKQIDHRWQPIGIRQSALEKMADRPAAANPIKRAIGVQPLQNIRL